MILKFILREKKTRIVNPILREESKFGRLTLPDFKPFYKATAIGSVIFVKG